MSDPDAARKVKATLFDELEPVASEAPPVPEPKPAAADAKTPARPASGKNVDKSSGKSPERRSTAQEMAGRQREISVSEFFTKNRHLLGFDSPLKALLTAVKEAVDNSLDACEEAGILPEITVQLVQTGEDRYR